MGDFLLVFDRSAHFDQLFDRGFRSLFDAATNRRWVAAGDDVPQTFAEDRASQHGCGGRAVTSQIAGLLSDFDDQLGTHVFESVFQFDFFGDGHAVFGHGRTTKRFVDDHIATGWPHRDRNRVGQLVDARQHAGSGVVFKK